MAKLGLIIPEDLETKLRPLLPWGTKSAVIEELLWELVDRAREEPRLVTRLHIRNIERRKAP